MVECPVRAKAECPVRGRMLMPGEEGPKAR